MKRVLFLVIALLLLITIVFVGINWWNVNSRPVSSSEKPTRFVVPKGRSAGEIGEMLYGESLIRSPLAFKFYVQVTDRAKKIQSGEYTLSSHLSLTEMVDRLTGGPEELWVTVPEGLRREEIVERIVVSLKMDGEQVSVFRQEFLEETEALEGYLFPDTYLFAHDVPASLVVRKLSDTFNEKIELLRNDIDSSDYTQNQLIGLASIIERETKVDEERPIVAGILLNRFEADWPLQADATVQYAIASENCKLEAENCDDWWPILTKEDLKINSQYNSYKFTGLPPAPIANAGFSSIEAAVNPQESQYWYYIHDPEGNIHYARTISEHNANVRKYLGK